MTFKEQIQQGIPNELPSKKDNQLIVQLDEHTVFNLNVTAKPR